MKLHLKPSWHLKHIKKLDNNVITWMIQKFQGNEFLILI